MADDQNRTPQGHSLQGLAHQALAFRVKPGGRLVQHHQRRPTQISPGKSQTLQFTSRQSGAAPPQDGVQPMGEMTYELAGSSSFKSRIDLVVISVRVPQKKIFPHRSESEIWRLRHPGKLGPP